MSLTAQQIVTAATQIAKAPGFTSQAGQLLNSILEEMAFTYNIDVGGGKKTFNFNFNPGLISSDPNISPGSGPYPLPADYLRADEGDIQWFLQGVPYQMIPIDIKELDLQIQQAGLQSFPYLWATDMETSPPGAYVWPPASGAFPVRIRYHALPADIATPETSATVPWFPYQTYLITRLAGELMRFTGDDRMTTFLGDGPEGAQGMLRRYLQLKDDKGNRAQKVRLDKRRFGASAFNALRNTKSIGW